MPCPVYSCSVGCPAKATRLADYEDIFVWKLTFAAVAQRYAELPKQRYRILFLRETLCWINLLVFSTSECTLHEPRNVSGSPFSAIPTASVLVRHSRRLSHPSVACPPQQPRARLHTHSRRDSAFPHTNPRHRHAQGPSRALAIERASCHPR